MSKQKQLPMLGKGQKWNPEEFKAVMKEYAADYDNLVSNAKKGPPGVVTPDKDDDTRGVDYRQLNQGYDHSNLD